MMLQENDSSAPQQETFAHENLPPPGEIVLGELSGIDENGQPLVSFSLDKRYGPVAALATIPIAAAQVGRQIGLLFAQSNKRTPVIVGVIHNALQSLLENIEIAEAVDSGGKLDTPDSVAAANPDLISTNSCNDVIVEGRKIILQGEEEVVLRCGDSSITLHKNGKISIRGKYLLNRSSGVNRIMGGSVQVN